MTAHPPLGSADLDWARLLTKLAPDRAVAEPSYLQLKKKIAAFIESGVIAEGQSLPSERVLAEALNLSRVTVRRAYDELRHGDYLATHGRAGVTAKAPPRLSPKLGRLKGFTEEMRELGMEPSTQLLSREVVSDRTMASLFGRPSTARFLRLLRLRLGDGTPLSRELAWYDLALAPQMEDWDIQGSAYQFLCERCGICLSHGEQTIEAVMSSAEESEVFGYTQAGPCLLMKRRTYSLSGQIVEYVEGTFRGDAYAYRLTLNLP